MYQRRHTATTGRRDGFVLLAVLVVIVLLSLAAYQFAELTTAEYRAADSHTRSVQAHTLAASGIDYAAMMLSTSGGSSPSFQGSALNNPSTFQGIAVGTADTARRQGRFSIVSPAGPDEIANGQPFRFGATDESGKINLNALMQIDPSGNVAYNMLMQLPNMTADVANSIVDWLDPDDTPRSDGAEEDYYQSLSPPYHCKNGPLDSVEELLLVKGVTPQLLLGNDRNRNGVLDPDENDGSGAVQPGWAAYLTVYSREQNVSSQGQRRIYINDSDLQTLHQNLETAVGQQMADYIVAYRMYGPASSGTGSGGGSGAGAAVVPPAARSGTGAAAGASGAGRSGATSGAARGGTTGQSSVRSGGGGGGGGGGSTVQVSPAMMSSGGGRSRIASLFDLVNSKVSVPGSTPGAQATDLQSPLNDTSQLAQLLPQVLDQLTTVNSPEIPARININTAPAAVLAALPGLSQADAQTILEHRPDPSTTNSQDPTYQTAAWLITSANLPPKTLSSLERYITAQTQVYRVQAVGYFDGGGPTARIEAVIDTNQQNPRIVVWRDLSDMGGGFDLSQGAGQR